MELIGNKTNFCEEEFLAKTKKMFEGISIYINSHNLGDNIYQIESRNVFQKLNES